MRQVTAEIELTPIEVLNEEAVTRYVVNCGGTRCFSGDQLVITGNGDIPISEIRPGEEVLTYNGKRYQLKPVVEVLRMKNEKLVVRIRLKSGREIKVTDDHEFFFEGEWKDIKYILSLWEKSHEENTKI